MVWKEEQVQGCVKSSRDKRKRVSYDAEAGSFVQKNNRFYQLLLTEPDPNTSLFLLLFIRFCSNKGDGGKQVRHQT